MRCRHHPHEFGGVDRAALLISGGRLWPALQLHLEEGSPLLPGYGPTGVGIGLTISPAASDALGAAHDEKDDRREPDAVMPVCVGAGILPLLFIAPFVG